MAPKIQMRFKIEKMSNYAKTREITRCERRTTRRKYKDVEARGAARA